MGQTKEEKIIKQVIGNPQQVQKQTPIATDMFIPNYSGIKDEVKKTFNGDMVTATDDGTYITLYTKGTALFRLEKATGQIQIKAGMDSDTTF